MRKLFLLIPALMLALAINAAVINVNPGNNTIRAAIYNSATSDGDVIVLADGTYTDDNYIELIKSVEIKAADGAHPVIALNTYIKVYGGKHTILRGLSFDGSAQGSRDQYFRFTDNGDNELEIINCTFTGVKKNIFRCESGKKFALLDVKNCTFAGSLSNVMKLESNLCGAAHFDGCEFSNTAEIVIHGLSTSHLDECVVNNCYFHDNAKQSIYFEASGTEGTETCDELTVTNSTFANTTALSNWISVIDIRPNSATNTIKVEVDHCTFYNNPCVDSGHANIRTHDISDVAVSNSIFMHPTELAQRATFCDGGGTVSNCIAYNFTKDPSNYAHAWGPTVTSCAIADPLFNDLVNNKYTYAGTYGVSMSPARGASTDGSDLGDPRWYTDVIYPSTNFAGGYTFTADKAELSGSILYETSGPNGPYLRYNAPDVPGTASWIIQATRACHVNVTVNMADNSWNQASDANYKNGNHIFGVELWDGNVRKDTVAEGEYGDGKQDGYATYPTVNLGSIEIPAAGLYTVKLLNPRGWAKCGVESVSLTYQGGDVQSMPATTNINDAWFSPNGTRADGKISFPYGHMNEGWVMWNVAFANAANYKVTVNIENANGHNYTVGLYENESALTPIVYVSEGEQKSTLSTLDLGSMEVAAGNYVMKVTNETQYSDAKLISVKLEYLGGGTVNIPNVAIPFADAILSSHAFTDANGLHFADNDHLGHIDEEYAKWNIHAAGGIYRFVAHCSSTNWSHLKMRVLSGNTELYSFTTEYAYNQDDKEIKSPEWFLAAGDYVLELSNPAKHSNGYLKSLAATAAENIFIVDENETDADVIAGKAETSWKALLQRTFKGGVYNSFCIPVEPGLGELETAFGAGYELLELESATLDGGVLNLNFTTASSVSAGKPYLIKPVADVANPIFNAHNIHNYTGNNIQSVGVVDFIGNFVKKTIDASENNLYLGTDDKLYFSPNDVTIKGLRAYFKVNVPNPSLVVKRARIVTPNNMPTEIDLVGAENQTLKTIENGQLIIFRDGKKYNAMGIKLQ